MRSGNINLCNQQNEHLFDSGLESDIDLHNGDELCFKHTALCLCFICEKVTQKIHVKVFKMKEPGSKFYSIQTHASQQFPVTKYNTNQKHNEQQRLSTELMWEKIDA